MASTHDLDFEWPDFVNFRQLPPVGDASLRGWVLLCTIVGNESLMRPMYRMEDETGTSFLLAFYLENDQPRTKELASLKPGQMLVLKNAQQKQFMDGQIGIRMEDEQLDDVTVLPCTIAKFKEINALLCDENSNCALCQQENPTKSCSRCKTRYCSQQCQTDHWNVGHKKNCKIVACLRELNIMFA